MYKIAVCDDEAVSRKDVINSIRKVIPEDMVEITEYVDGRDLLYDVGEGECFDILMLDISMSDMDGMTVAAKIREGGVCSGSIIFFITSYEANISRIVDLNPMAYIFKPVTENEMKERLKKAVDLLRRNSRVLEFVSNRHDVRVRIEDIMYVESNARGIEVYIKGESYKTYTYRINDIISKISHIDFMRCHNSYIVNKNYVKRVSSNELIMYDGKSIPVSRRYHKEIFEVLEV